MTVQRKKGTPRPAETYRGYLRNNSGFWKLQRHARRLRWKALGLAK